MRYHLAPVNQVFVKQIPLIRLELTEIKEIFPKFRKRAEYELRMKHGKKSKIYKQWIEEFYYDVETGTFKSQEIIADMLKIAKENNMKPILTNFKKNENTTSHYYLIMKA